MKQMQMDFTRADQLGWLDTAVIGATPIVIGTRTVNVSGKLSKAVLRCIDSHGRGIDGRCFVSVDTIARETGYSEKSIDRAIAALRLRSLVMVDDSKRTNRYTIVWGELATLASRSVKHAQSSVSLQLLASSDKPLQSANSAPAIRDMVTLTRDMVSPIRDMVSTTRDMVTPKPYETKKPPPTDARESSKAAGDFSFSSEDWVKVEERLQSLRPKLDRWPVAVRDAKRLGIDPGNVLAIIDEFCSNRDKFRGPGAIIDRIRSGSWCVSILSSADLEEAKLRAIEKAKAKDRNTAEFLKARSRPMAPWSSEELAGLAKLGVKL